MESRFVNHKLLRCGYTTGSCAAAAAKGAVLMLLGDEPRTVRISTPRGIELALDVLEPSLERGEDGSPVRAACAVEKDAGDDPDITNGAYVYALARWLDAKEAAEQRPDLLARDDRFDDVIIDGGVGVGRVTLAGLDQPVGSAAINSVPRAMIAQACREALASHGLAFGAEGAPAAVEVIISIPSGVELARRTFNPHLGIEGGISVLGTSGIVDPMSEAALVDTVRAEVSVIAATGAKDLLVTLGNYGERFATQQLGLSIERNHVTCSNLIGDTLSAAIENGMERVLLVGHIGKLVKVGLGITNTHSHNGDGRIECLVSCALACGADLAVLSNLQACVTTDAAIDVLAQAGLLQFVMAELAMRIDANLKRYTVERIEVAFVGFTDRGYNAGVLFASGNAEKLMECWRDNA